MRVSTEGQLDGSGIEQQKASIAAYCAISGIVIGQWVVESATGTTDEREQIQGLLEQARQGALQRLVIDRIDRLGRHLVVTEKLFDAFKAAGVEVVVVGLSLANNPQGIFMRQMFGAMAQLDRAQWLQRMTQCKRAKVSTSGTWSSGGRLPYGFCTLSHGKLAIDSRESAVVLLCFAAKRDGRSLRETCQLLQRKGYKTRKGTDFAPAQISRILEAEPQYRGLKCFGNTQAGVPPQHPAILRADA